MMNELNIPPKYQVDNPISKRFKPNRRFAADELPTWVEQSQDLMLRSTVSFLIVTYSGTFLTFYHLSSCIFPCPHLFLAIYALHAGYLFVTDTLSTPTITEPPSMECQDLLITTRLNACVYSQNRPRFKVPSERLSNEVQFPICLRDYAMTNRNRVFCYH